ncbi:hypothetical protein NXY40_21780 [Phocaeicola vulgatus]|nr:hypothetical protein [Phocaeicola vulgatus]
MLGNLGKEKKKQKKNIEAAVSGIKARVALLMEDGQTALMPRMPQ